MSHIPVPNTQLTVDTTTGQIDASADDHIILRVPKSLLTRAITHWAARQADVDEQVAFDRLTDEALEDIVTSLIHAPGGLLSLEELDDAIVTIVEDHLEASCDDESPAISAAQTQTMLARLKD